MHSNGERANLDSLLRLRTFNLVKEQIMAQEIPVSEISNEDMATYLGVHGLGPDQLSEEELALLSKQPSSSQREALFFDWMEDQWSSNDVRIGPVYDNAVAALKEAPFDNDPNRDTDFEQFIIQSLSPESSLLTEFPDIVRRLPGKENLVLDPTCFTICLPAFDKGNNAANLVCDGTTFAVIGYVPSM